MLKNAIAVRSVGNEEIAKILTLPIAMMSGTRAMQAAGRIFLPQDVKESDALYSNRLSRSILYPGYKRTLNYLAGQVFGKQLKCPDNFSLPDVWDDSDKRGHDVTVFSRKVFSAGINTGASFILVDMPLKGTAITSADEKDQKIRPYFVLVRSENIIGHRVDSNGKLIELRILESAEVPDGEYKVKIENRIRLLRPGYYAVYCEGKRNEWTLLEEGNTSLDYIPIAGFMPGEKRSVVTADPPLEDLAWLNLAHWQSQSDQRNILHIARVPLLFGKMMEDDVMIAGTSTMLNTMDEHGDLKYVEHTGAAIAAGRQDLEDLKTDMAFFGMQMVVRNTGNETATGRAIDAAESDSTLKSWAILFQDTLNTAIGFMMDYVNNSNYDDIVEINTDFRNMLHEFTTKELVDAAREGIVAKQLVFDEFKRRGMLRCSETWEENVTLIESEGRVSSSVFSGFADSALG